MAKPGKRLEPHPPSEARKREVGGRSRAGRGKEGLATGGYVSASVMSVGIRLQETATGSLQDELKRESGKETVFVIATILQYSTQTCVETAAALS